MESYRCTAAVSAVATKLLARGAYDKPEGDALEGGVPEALNPWPADAPRNRLGLAKLALMGLQLSPLFWLKPPITYLNPAARAEFVDRRFKREIIQPGIAGRVCSAQGKVAR